MPLYLFSMNKTQPPSQDFAVELPDDQAALREAELARVELGRGRSSYARVFAFDGGGRLLADSHG
jgi:hypothetical protein